LAFALPILRHDSNSCTYSSNISTCVKTILLIKIGFLGSNSLLLSTSEIGPQASAHGDEQGECLRTIQVQEMVFEEFGRYVQADLRMPSR
jgi:hypothetical protein